MPATLDDVLQELKGLRRDLAAAGPPGAERPLWMPLARAAALLGVKYDTLQKHARDEWRRSGRPRIFDLDGLRFRLVPGSKEGSASFRVLTETVERKDITR